MAKGKEFLIRLCDQPEERRRFVHEACGEDNLRFESRIEKKRLITVAVGTKLGRYEIRSQPGAGGMGEVYLASDTKLQRSVTLKILPAEVAVDRNR